MTCPTCESPNDPSARRCVQCRAPLGAESPHEAFDGTPSMVAAGTNGAPVALAYSSPEHADGHAVHASSGWRGVHPAAPDDLADDPDRILGAPDSFQRALVIAAFIAAVLLMPFAGWLPTIAIPIVVMLMTAGLSVPIYVAATRRLPFSSAIGNALGAERSLRRRVIYAAAFAFPVVLFWYWLTDDTLVFAYRALVTTSVMFYLTGTVSVWRPMAGEQTVFVGGLAAIADDLRDVIVHALRAEVIAPQVREVDALEGPLLAMADVDTARRTTRLVEVTHDRARVIVRSQDYGEHLYLRWDTYVDFSGLRVTLIVRSVFALLSNAALRWFGTNISQWSSELAAIVFGSNETTGAKEIETGRMTVERIPSYVFDNVIALDQLVGRLSQERVNTALERANRSERLRVSASGDGRRTTYRLF